MLDSTRIRVAAIWAFTGNWTCQVVVFITTVVMTRLIAPEQYGIMALALVATTTADVAINAGLPQALVQRSTLEEQHVNTAFWVLLILGLVLAVVTFMAAEPASIFARAPELSDVLRSLSPLPILSAIAAVPTAMLRREMLFRKLAFRSLISAVAGSVVGIVMALSGYGVWALVFSALVRAAVSVVVLWWGNLWRPAWQISRQCYWELNRFSLWTLVSIVTSTCLSHLPTIIIGAGLGPAALGLYSVGSKLTECLALILIIPVQAVGLPAVARIQDQPEEIKKLVISIVRSLTLITFPAFLGLLAIAPDAVRLLFGDAWLPSVPVVQALCIVGAVRSVLAFSGSVLQGIGRADSLLPLALIDHLPLAAAAALLLPSGINAVAAGMAAAYILMAPLNFWIVQRGARINLSYLPTTILPNLSAALVMCAAVLFWRWEVAYVMTNIAAVSSSIIVGIAVFLLAVMLLSPTAMGEHFRLLRSTFQARTTN